MRLFIFVFEISTQNKRGISFFIVGLYYQYSGISSIWHVITSNKTFFGTQHILKTQPLGTHDHVNFLAEN